MYRSVNMPLLKLRLSWYRNSILVQQMFNMALKMTYKCFSKLIIVDLKR